MHARQMQVKSHPNLVRCRCLTGFVLALLACATVLSAQTTPPTTAPLAATPSGFLLNGKPFRILSGEMEYTRIPRAYWRDRLRKARAMGLNAVTVYVFWNVHEPEPGVYNFSGQDDVAEFLREAQQEGLYVILRPGPYVCAEWDLGGYPAWLFRDHDIKLRSLQPQYFAQATKWMMRLGKELAPLQASHGGPIIAVQVENEYGSFGDDHAYMQQMHKLLLRAGFDSSLLYTADGADVLSKGSLPDLIAAVDFGTGDAERSINLLKKQRPNQPVYVAEYWDGWFDHWGEKHQTTDAAKQEAEVKMMLEQGDSLSLYMVHGGTSWGWMNGANNDHGGYQPDVTSYDYDAPLDESGRPRPKYFRLRQIIQEATHLQPPPVPVSPPLITLPPIALKQSVSLWDTLPASVHKVDPPSMEDVGQSYGYILYRTRVTGAGETQLAIDTLHDYARIYVDGKLAGVLDRRLGVKAMPLKLTGSHRLDILIENSGRINFTQAIRGERAGILGEVRLGGSALHGWQVFPLPLKQPPATGYKNAPCDGPCFLRASFDVKTPGDTYLNMRQFTKGVVWVNGHLLGRFWRIGPTGALYLPGAWLRKGSNEIVVMDLRGGKGLAVTGEDHQTYFTPQPEEGISLPASTKPAGQ